MGMRSVGASLVLGLLASSAAHADAVLSFAPVVVGAPDSRNFGNSQAPAGTLTTGTTSGTLPGPTYNFLDTWNFTLSPSANGGGFVGTFNFTDPGNGLVTQGIDNLQLRLVGPSPSTSTIVGWQSGTTLPGAQQVISLIPTQPLVAGNYALQVRGLLTGNAYSYAGTFQTTAVPLPPALPLLAAGLLAFFTLAKRRRFED